MLGGLQEIAECEQKAKGYYLPYNIGKTTYVAETTSSLGFYTIFRFLQTLCNLHSGTYVSPSYHILYEIHGEGEQVVVDYILITYGCSYTREETGVSTYSISAPT